MTAACNPDQACSEFDDDYRVLRPPESKVPGSAFAQPEAGEFERLAKERDMRVMAPDSEESWE